MERLIINPMIGPCGRSPKAGTGGAEIADLLGFLQDDQAWIVRLVANKAVRTPVRLGLRDRQ